MHRVLISAIVLSLAPAVPLIAQAESGHVYGIRYHQVHQGQDQAYATAYEEIIRPVFNEAKERGVIVSYLDLVQAAGSGETTHLLITEYANWADVGEALQKLNEISQEVLGQSLNDAIAGLPEMRDYLRTEFYTSIVP